MDAERLAEWVMTGAIVVMGALVLALFYLPGLQPSAAVLDCDRSGGVYSSETGTCAASDSPLAGLAA